MLNWKKLVTPAVVVMIIMALVGAVYSQMDKKVEKNTAEISEVRKSQDGKVDNATLREMIQMQQKLFEVQIKNTKEQLNQVYEEIKDIRKKE